MSDRSIEEMRLVKRKILTDDSCRGKIRTTDEMEIDR